MSFGTHTVDADAIKARVDRVHIEGIGRTKDDVLEKTVKSLFDVNDVKNVRHIFRANIVIQLYIYLR
jgi:hypothetical protein